MNCGQLLVLHDALFGVNEGDGLAVLKALNDMCRYSIAWSSQTPPADVNRLVPTLSYQSDSFVATPETAKHSHLVAGPLEK